jgi:acyl-ACP thioesterase
MRQVFDNHLSEKDLVYEAETELSELNENNILKPYAYQTLFAQIVEQHLNKINANVDVTMRYNLAWALMSLSFELLKPVKGCIKLYANTWYSQRKGPYFSREFEFRNEEGQLMFHGTTFSVLLEVDKRTVFRKRELPFYLHEPIEEFTIKAEPSFTGGCQLHKIAERKVYNSYIDCLGHVNNCRYGEFAYDALTDEECKNLDRLKRMDFFFLHELRPHDNFSILKAGDGNRIFVQGYNSYKNSPAFDIIMQFAD